MATNKPNMARKAAHRPETPEATATEEPVVEVEHEIITDPDGVEWEEFGTCMVCGVQLYHPLGAVKNTSWITRQQSVSLATGGRTCQEHDPYIKQRFLGIQAQRIDGMRVNPVMGDQWTPEGRLDA